MIWGASDYVTGGVVLPALAMLEPAPLPCHTSIRFDTSYRDEYGEIEYGGLPVKDAAFI